MRGFLFRCFGCENDAGREHFLQIMPYMHLPTPKNAKKIEKNVIFLLKCA